MFSAIRGKIDGKKTANRGCDEGAKKNKLETNTKPNDTPLDAVDSKNRSRSGKALRAISSFFTPQKKMQKSQTGERAGEDRDSGAEEDAFVKENRNIAGYCPPTEKTLLATNRYATQNNRLSVAAVRGNNLSSLDVTPITSCDVSKNPSVAATHGGDGEWSRRSSVRKSSSLAFVGGKGRSMSANRCYSPCLLLNPSLHGIHSPLNRRASADDRSGRHQTHLRATTLLSVAVKGAMHDGDHSAAPSPYASPNPACFGDACDGVEDRDDDLLSSDDDREPNAEEKGNAIRSQDGPVGMSEEKAPACLEVDETLFDATAKDVPSASHAVASHVKDDAAYDGDGTPEKKVLALSSSSVSPSHSRAMSPCVSFVVGTAAQQAAFSFMLRGISGGRSDDCDGGGVVCAADDAMDIHIALSIRKSPSMASIAKGGTLRRSPSLSYHHIHDQHPSTPAAIANASPSVMNTNTRRHIVAVTPSRLAMLRSPTSHHLSSPSLKMFSSGGYAIGSGILLGTIRAASMGSLRRHHGSPSSSPSRLRSIASGFEEHNAALHLTPPHQNAEGETFAVAVVTNEDEATYPYPYVASSSSCDALDVTSSSFAAAAKPSFIRISGITAQPSVALGDDKGVAEAVATNAVMCSVILDTPCQSSPPRRKGHGGVTVVVRDAAAAAAASSALLVMAAEVVEEEEEPKEENEEEEEEQREETAASSATPIYYNLSYTQRRSAVVSKLSFDDDADDNSGDECQHVGVLDDDDDYEEDNHSRWGNGTCESEGLSLEALTSARQLQSASSWNSSQRPSAALPLTAADEGRATVPFVDPIVSAATEHDVSFSVSPQKPSGDDEDVTQRFFVASPSDRLPSQCREDDGPMRALLASSPTNSVGGVKGDADDSNIPLHPHVLHRRQKESNDGDALTRKKETAKPIIIVKKKGMRSGKMNREADLSVTREQGCPCSIM